MPYMLGVQVSPPMEHPATMRMTRATHRTCTHLVDVRAVWVKRDDFDTFLDEDLVG